MAARKKTALEEEKLTDNNLDKVVKMLEEKATKKDCCIVLGIAYNTTRLQNLVDNHLERKARDAERRASLRGKPLSKEETSFIIQEYLERAPLEHISKSTFRSVDMIKNVLSLHQVPIRAASFDYFSPEVFPDGAVREKYEIGEVVYSSRYDSKASIEKEFTDPKNLGFIYRIWLMNDEWKQYAYAPAYELASLAHLKEIGVTL